MTVRVALNGLGSSGRAVVRALMGRQDLILVAVNDLPLPPAAIAHLIRFDSGSEFINTSVEVCGQNLLIADRQVELFAEKNPAAIPWKRVGAQIVIETLPLMTRGFPINSHLKAGAEKVIFLSPEFSGNFVTLLHGMNDDCYDPQRHSLIACPSAAACCLAVLAEVLNRVAGIRRIEAWAGSASASAGLRDCPSCAPWSNAGEVNELMPSIAGKLNRAADYDEHSEAACLVVEAETKTAVSTEGISKAFRDAACSFFAGILTCCMHPVREADIKNDPHVCIFDASQTRVISPKTVRLKAWFNPEQSLAGQVTELAGFIGRTVMAV